MCGMPPYGTSRTPACLTPTVTGTRCRAHDPMRHGLHRRVALTASYLARTRRPGRSFTSSVPPTPRVCPRSVCDDRPEHPLDRTLGEDRRRDRRKATDGTALLSDSELVCLAVAQALLGYPLGPAGDAGHLPGLGILRVHNLLASRRHASRRPHNLWPAAAARRERRRPAKPAAASSAPAAVVSSHGAGSAAGLDAIPPRPVEVPPLGMIWLPAASIRASIFSPEGSSSTTMV